MAMNHGETAAALFEQGYNCAQSTAAAFAADFGLEPSQVIRAMAGFGAGLGGLRETCGAVSAMAYIAGLHASGYSPGDLESKAALYATIQGMVREFQEQHGTICCRELLERAGCAVVSSPSERTADYYAKRPCARIVASAAEIIARALNLSA